MTKIANISECGAQEGLTVVSDSVIEIVMSGLPYRVDLEHYRGDRFSFSIIGRNEDDTPFNFSDILDSARTQCKVARRGSAVQAEFTDANHVLGQSQDAIDFDVDEGNAPGTTLDEIHISDPQGSVLDVVYERLQFDTEALTSDDEPRTLVQGEVEVLQDVTRD